MSAPWEALVSAVGGSVLAALLLVVAGYFGKRMFEQAIERSAEYHRSMLAQTAELQKADFAQRAEAQKAALAQVSAFDTDLRQRRIPEYTKLWSLTKLLPKWPRANDVTSQDLHKLSKALRDWYFSGGGMLLSAESFDAYSELQDRLAEFLSGQADPAQPISDPDYDRIRGYCSAVRAQLAADIVSRVQRRWYSLPD